MKKKLSNPRNLLLIQHHGHSNTSYSILSPSTKDKNETTDVEITQHVVKKLLVLEKKISMSLKIQCNTRAYHLFLSFSILGKYKITHHSRREAPLMTLRIECITRASILFQTLSWSFSIFWQNTRSHISHEECITHDYYVATISPRLIIMWTKELDAKPHCDLPNTF